MAIVNKKILTDAVALATAAYSSENAAIANVFTSLGYTVLAGTSFDDPSLEGILFSHQPSDSFDENNYYDYLNAQAIVGRSSHTLVLAFRGTQPEYVADLLNDVLWINGHYSLFDNLIDGIDLYLDRPENAGIKDVYVFGHSLGGAMAELFLEGHPPNETGPSYHAITIGSPGPVHVFSTVYDSRILNFEHTGDPIVVDLPLAEPTGTGIEIDRPSLPNGTIPLGPYTEHSTSSYYASINAITYSKLYDYSSLQHFIIIGDLTADAFFPRFDDQAIFVLGIGGADTLAGGSADDLLDGGGNADRLIGGAGSNLYSGGPGNDTFEISGDWLIGGTPRLDRIIDYDQGNAGYYAGVEGDVIDLTNIVGSYHDWNAALSAVTPMSLFRAQPATDGKSSTVYVRSPATAAAANPGDAVWLPLVRLDGIRAGHILNVRADPDAPATTVGLVVGSASSTSIQWFDFPMGTLDSNGQRTATPANDGDGFYSANAFGEFSNNASLRDYHLGEDWNYEGAAGADLGAEVRTIGTGTIVFAGDGGTGWGNVVIVKHMLPDGAYGGFVTSFYGHLGDLAVSVAQTVQRGTVLGTIAQVDDISPHLHFEIRTGTNPLAEQVGHGYSDMPRPDGWLDPTDFIQAHRGQNADPVASTWSISPTSISVGEAQESVTFTITRSGSTAAQTVYVSTTINQGSYNDSDYVYWLNQPFAFMVGQSSHTVTVQINDDLQYEQSETFGVVVQASASDPASRYLAQTTFTIQDDDAEPIDPGVGVNFDGTEENDIWSGTARNDTASGKDGNDRLSGGAGDDYLNGMAGDDRLFGNDGNDYLDSGGGADTLLGGNGNDSIQVVAPGAATIDGGAGFDSLVLYRPDLAQAIYIDPGPGGDSYAFGLPDGTSVIGIEQLYLATGSGNDRVTFANTTTPGHQHWAPGGGNDTAIVDFSALSLSHPLIFSPVIPRQ